MNISDVSSIASTELTNIEYGSNSVENGAGQKQINGVGPNNLVQDIFQALKESGINLPPPPPPGNAKQDGDAHKRGDENPVGQAIHQLMHDLFQALKPSSTNETNSSDDRSAAISGNGSKYNDLISNLHNLISSVGSDNSSSSHVVQKLQEDFNNLVNLTNNNQPTNANSENLQNFLNQILNNINTGQASNMNSAGSIFSVAV